MKFRNTKEDCKVRLENPNSQDSGNYTWKTLKTNEIIELPKQVGIRYGFKVEIKIKEENAEKLEVTESSIGKTKVETKQLKKKEYQKKILSIKGIGKKTMEDIIKIYPFEEDLINSIKNNEHLPIKDNIEKILKEKYDRL